MIDAHDILPPLAASLGALLGALLLYVFVRGARVANADQYPTSGAVIGAIGGRRGDP